MLSKLFKFRNKYESPGIHPPENKLSHNKSIEKVPLPKKVVITNSQHIGAPAKFIVNRGDEVKTGQKIAEATGYVSVPIHATISGKVTQITKIVSSVTSQIIDAVVITSDEKDEWVDLEGVKSPLNASSEELIEKIKESGIVGLGGATFPTHVKLKPPEGKVIDTIIVNGCECEPYITSDHRLMLENSEHILLGLNLVMKILSCDRAYVAIEDNKMDAVEHMKDQIAKLKLTDSVEVKVMKSQYPMGGEKTLIKSVLGKEVPYQGLPLDVGVVVHNVATLTAIYDAVYEGKPLVERVVTVTGLVNDSKNLVARLGIEASELIDFCGGSQNAADKIVFGGPMMGISQVTAETATSKGTNCILVTKANLKKERNCIRCSTCIDTCPMRLMPTIFVSLVKNRLFDELDEYYVDNCVECGSCAYKCPANIPLVQYIKLGKGELLARRKAK